MTTSRSPCDTVIYAIGDFQGRCDLLELLNSRITLRGNHVDHWLRYLDGDLDTGAWRSGVLSCFAPEGPRRDIPRT